jgi:hypothetical protein
MSRSKYPNVTEAIFDLQARGYEYDFTLTGLQLRCNQENIILKAMDFELHEMYYFRDKGRWHKERMVYAICASDYCIKGILLISGTRNTDLFPTVIYDKLQSRCTCSGNMAGTIIL